MQLRKQRLGQCNSRSGRHLALRFSGLASLLLGALLWPADQAAQQAGVAQTLTPQQAFERELLGGQTHTYQFQLLAGEYVKLTVSQRGIDVVLRVFGPNGEQLLESDGPGAAQSLETAALVAEVAGRYQLAIAAADKDAPLGRYEVQMSAPHPATPGERDEAAAERELEKGTRLLAQGAKETLEAALQHFDTARTLFHRLGNAGQEGNALNFMGILCLTRGETRRAIGYLNQAWEIQQHTGEPQAKAALLGNLAVAHNQLGEPVQAAERLQQAIPLMRAAADRGGEAKLRVSLGSVLQTLGQFEPALEALQQALVNFRALGDKGSEGVTLNNLGTLYRGLGEPARALDAFQQALPLLRAAGDKRVEAIALDNLGVLQRASGNFQAALESFQQALAQRRALGDKRGEGITLSNLGHMYQILGAAPQALVLQLQALPLLQATGDNHRRALALDRVGSAYRQMGELSQALAYHEQALPLLEAVGDQLAQAAVLKNIAWLKREQQDWPTARANIEQALTLLESLRANVNSPELRTSFLGSVAEYYEFYTDLLMQLHTVEPDAGYARTALESSEKARARSLLDLLGEARVNIRQGVETTLLEREQKLKNQLTVKLDQLTRLLNSKATAEQQRAARAAVDQLVAAYQQVQADIRQTSPAYAALAHPAPLSATAIQQLLDADTVLLEYALGERQSHLWVVTPDSLKAYALPPRAEIERQARRVYELLTARQPQPGRTAAQQLGRLKQAEAEYPAQAAALSRLLFGAVTEQLGKRRLAIVADGALAYLPLAVLPDPADVAQPLLATHEIVFLPSASTLAAIRRETAGRSQPPVGSVAVLADPVFEANDPRVLRLLSARHLRATRPGKLKTAAASSSTSPTALSAELGHALRSFHRPDKGSASVTPQSDLPRLPFSREEAEAIAALAPAGQVFKALGFQANRATVMTTDFGRYRLLHLATHGLLNAAHPELSGLVFSLLDDAGQAQDGFLRLHEIYNLRLPVEVVVLSACQTALGKEVRGEGLIGLTRGFMYAGAPRVAASLWQVDDLATAELMKRFYRSMLKEGLRPAAALRAAQLGLRQEKRYAAPFYWGAFVLQGEWK